MLTEPDSMSIDEFSLEDASIGSLSIDGRQKLSLSNELFGETDLDISDAIDASFIHTSNKKSSKHQNQSLIEDISFDLNDSLLELENNTTGHPPNSHRLNANEFQPRSSKPLKTTSLGRNAVKKANSFDDASFISQSDHSLLRKNSLFPRISGTPNENMLEKMKILESELHSKESQISQLQSKLASLETSKMEDVKKIEGKIAQEISSHVRKIRNEFKKEFDRKCNELKLAVAIQHSYGSIQSAEAMSDEPVMSNHNIHLQNGARKTNPSEPAIQKNNPTMFSAPSKANDCMELCPPNNDPSFITLWSNFKPLKSGFNHSLGYTQVDDPQKQASTRLYQDGAKISIHKDGLVEEQYPGKCSYKRFASGDIRKDLPNGDVQYFFAKDGVKMIYSAERNQKVYLYKSGEKRQYFADGHVEIQHPEGRIEILRMQADQTKMKN